MKAASGGWEAPSPDGRDGGVVVDEFDYDRRRSWDGLISAVVFCFNNLDSSSYVDALETFFLILKESGLLRTEVGENSRDTGLITVRCSEV
jgi:hypothetical protein